MMTANALACGILLVCVSSAWSFNNDEIHVFRSHHMKALLDESNYDKYSRPYSSNESHVLVKTNIYVRAITNVDLKNHHYNVVLTLRQEWNDPRLVFYDYEGHIPYLTLTGADRLWIPDLFISNSLEEHDFHIVEPNTFERIYPNGNVLSSTRVMVQVALDRDTLKLPIRLASYGYTTDDIVFEWSGTDPVQISKNLKEDPRFHFDLATTTHCDSTTVTGKYSCLLAELGSSITDARHNREGARMLERQDETLRALIDHDIYNKDIRPIGTNGTQVIVKADMHILNIKEVDVEHEELTLIAYIRQRWNDARLEFDDHEGQIPTITVPNPHDIWIPDMFFPNSLKDKVYDVTVPNSFVRISPHGDVLLSHRVAVKVPCTTNDTHVDGVKPENLHCKLQMESYSYSTKDILYRWNPDKEHEVEHHLDIARDHYKIVYAHLGCHDVNLDGTEYSRLELTLDLHKV